MTLLQEVQALDVKAPEPIDVKKPVDDDLRFWSVTTIIGVLDKPALLYWAAEQSAIAAVGAAKSLTQRIEEDGEAEVIKWLRDARFRGIKGARTAAELGTDIHAACESYALTGLRPEVDEEVLPFLDQFDRWAQRWQPVYQAAELTVYSRQYGYAGTCDGFLTIDGQRLIVDYKTSRKSFDSKGKPSGPYPEVGLQLSAYRYADTAATWQARRYERFRRRYYLLSPDEIEMSVKPPEVDGGLCIHISPEHCDAYPVRCDSEVYESFLYLIETARFVNEVSKTIVGERLVHAEEV